MTLVLVIFLFLLITPSEQEKTPFCKFYEEHANDISDLCLSQLTKICDTNISFRMFDASSKLLIPGMSYSNVIDYGNFPECLAIKYEDKDGEILGKFCGLSVIIANVFLSDATSKVLTKFGVDVSKREVDISLEAFDQMKPHFRDILDPNVSFVLSKYSSCVPDACTPREVGKFFLFGNSIVLENDSLSLFIYTDLECETINSNTDYEWGDVFFIVFLCILGEAIILCTLYDAYCQNFQIKPHHPLLLAFSVIYNGKKLLAISNNKTEQIQCFNGMRFISMMWVVAYHASSPFQAGVISLENFPDVQAWQNQWTVQYVLSALLAVDTFFYIAGFLVSFSYLKTSLDKPPVEQLKTVPKMYLHRYLRLTPSVGAMYLVTITVFRFFGTGPTWSLITHFLKDTCKEKWWKFFLYIQNYTDPDEMCVNPTWYLSADMQMFILAPIIMIPTATYIKKYYKQTMWALGALATATIAFSTIPRFVNNEPGNIYTSHERFNNFIIGFMFGAFMRMKRNHKFIFNAWMNVFLWAVVLVVGLAFNIFWFDIIYHFDITKYTLFMAFYRPIWCVSLCFMVYSCYHNQGGVIQWFLERPGFQILAKLSYSMYVLHVLVELFAAGTLKTTFYFSNYFLFYNFCGHIIVTMAISVIWVLAFEYPMLTIDKYLLG